MDVRFVQRGTEIDEKLRAYMEGKISKLEKFFKRILHCQILVTFQKGKFSVETTANANGVILRAEESALEPRKAFDQALKNLERRIKRHNSYLKDKGQYHGDAEFSFSLEGAEAVTETTAVQQEPIIQKVKKVPLHPMDPKEAIMQMELVGHSFFMFQNGETGDVNVVYRRNDGDYGCLEPTY
ncbi:MAG: ribosome-associated translation inhibitor RaiA [Fretibacterium sp.]|nr:ribosome-associated translation inhibitor RaiA [Fretibacterium sp.]